MEEDRIFVTAASVGRAVKEIESMPKVIRQGKNTMRREEITDIDVLFSHDNFKRMIVRHLEVLREHCANYPRMDKSRKVTITLSLKPMFNPNSQDGSGYDKAVLTASVGSPSLPSTEVEFNCAVVNCQYAKRQRLPMFRVCLSGVPRETPIAVAHRLVARLVVTKFSFPAGYALAGRDVPPRVCRTSLRGRTLFLPP